MKHCPAITRLALNNLLDIVKISMSARLEQTIRIQGGATDSTTFVMVTECRHGHQSGRTIAYSKAENVEFLSIII